MPFKYDNLYKVLTDMLPIGQCGIPPLAWGTHPETLPVTFGTYIAYNICDILVYSCADIWIRKIGN